MNGQRIALDNGRFQLVTFRSLGGAGVVTEPKTGKQSRMLTPRELPQTYSELTNLSYKLLYNKP